MGMQPATSGALELVSLHKRGQTTWKIEDRHTNGSLGKFWDKQIIAWLCRWLVIHVQKEIHRNKHNV